MVLVTLPEIARGMGAHPDALRTFLRRHRPELLELGRRVGGSIGYEEQAAAQIREAFQGRRALALAT
jgi:hypothetical protein